MRLAVCQDTQVTEKEVGATQITQRPAP